MNRDSFSLEDRLAELREFEPPSLTPPQSSQVRERMLPGIQSALKRAHQARERILYWRRAGWGTGLLAAAAALVLLFRPGAREEGERFAIQPSGRGVEWVREGKATSLASGELFIARDADGVRTGDRASAEVVTPLTVRFTLQEKSSVSLTAARGTGAEQVFLLQGRLHISVPKLAQAASFRVVTRDAQVTVKGTEFEVELSPDPSPGTCVRVAEGTVSVKSQREAQTLTAGQSWCSNPTLLAPTNSEAGSDSGASSAQAATELPPSPSPSGKPPPPPRPSGGRSDPHPPRPAPPQPLPESTLAAENQLFGSALGSMRAGDPDRARAQFQLFLRRYPKSPLAAQATVELERLQGR